MNFLHTITFRITLWYLSILSILLVLFGIGVYMNLSNVLHTNLDRKLQTRAKQLSEFRDIISIVAGGTFEDEAGEYISFYYYDDSQLQHISTKGKAFPVSHEMINRAMAGESLHSTIESFQNEQFRVYIAPFTPGNPEIRPAQFSKKMNDRQRGNEDKRKRPPRYNDNSDQFSGNNKRDKPPPRDDRGRPPVRNDDKPDRKIIIESATLVVARPSGDIDTVLHLLMQIFSVAIPITIAVSAGGGIFLARRALKPVEQITNTAHKIGETDLSLRINVETQDELGHLGETLNQMISRLEKAFERQKEFTSDASHELRAPLAIIQAEATLSLSKERSAPEYRKTLESIADETENMASLTNKLLELARSDSGKTAYTFETINLEEFIQEICSEMNLLFDEKNLAVNTILSKQIRIRGDLNSLRRLMLNLLNNALRYTDPGGDITVKLNNKNTMAVISVSDTGIGIPNEQKPFIFKRFYRVDKSRSRSDGGCGLGLAICKHIVDAHKGRITVDSQPGYGTTFTVLLPGIL